MGFARASQVNATTRKAPSFSAAPRPVIRKVPAREVQPKLNIGPVNDPLEREADSVADRIMRMTDRQTVQARTPPVISRKCSACERETIHRKCAACEAKELNIQRKCACDAEEKTIRRKEAGQAPAYDAAGAANALSGGGRPLSAAARAHFEPRFGRDFSDVRVHTHDRAASAARAINAKAYTLGHDIAFAPSAFAFGTPEGNRLIAHELTHVVQQGAADSTIRRDVADPEFAVLHQTAPLMPMPMKAVTVQTPESFELKPGILYWNEPQGVCGGNCHGKNEYKPPRHVVASTASLVRWAERFIIEQGNRRPEDVVARIAMLGEYNSLHNDVELGTAAMVHDMEHDKATFAGDAQARESALEAIGAEIGPIKERAFTSLRDRAQSIMVEKVTNAIGSGAVPPNATLVTQPDVIRQMDCQKHENTDNELWHSGEPWYGRRICKSAPAGSEFLFEVVGHEGVYFTAPKPSFNENVFSKINENLVGLQWFSTFLESFLETMFVAPFKMLLDTGAKVVDMTTQGGEVLGLWQGHTCVSSTCKNYEECVKTRSPEDCKDDLLTGAVKEATIIIPIFEQGADCIGNHDAASCGAIAAMSMGLIEGQFEKLKPRFTEEAMVKSAFHQSGTGELDALRELRKEREARKAAETAERVAKTAEGNLRAHFQVEAIDFAKRNGLNPGKVVAELEVVRNEARAAENIEIPDDPDFDAKIKTKVAGEEHAYERETDSGVWCRFSVSSCRVPIDPEVDRMVDRAFDEFTKKKKGKGRRKAVAVPEPEEVTEAQYKKNRADAQKAFKHGDGPSQVSAEVGHHMDASAMRHVQGVSGWDVQSAHVLPSSIGKLLEEYSRENAETMLLDRDIHGHFDQYWKDWAQNQRRLGRTEVSVAEVQKVMAEAIENSKMTDAQKGAMYTLLNKELYKDLGLKSGETVGLPYPNINPLEGAKLRELKSEMAKAEKARSASERAGRAKEAKRLEKDIKAYQDMIDEAKRDKSRKGKSRLEALRLQMAKLKAQRQ